MSSPSQLKLLASSPKLDHRPIECFYVETSKTEQMKKSFARIGASIWNSIPYTLLNLLVNTSSETKLSKYFLKLKSLRMTILKSLNCSVSLAIYLSLGKYNNDFSFIYSFILYFGCKFFHLIFLFNLIILLSQFSVISFVLFYYHKFVFIFPPPWLAFKYVIKGGKVFFPFCIPVIGVCNCCCIWTMWYKLLLLLYLWNS